MNFNDIQSAWNKDQNGGSVPDRVDQLKPAGLPLDRIKKNLRNEFIYQVLSIILVAFLPKIHAFNPALTVWFYVTYAIFVAICAYYLIKLFGFYKRIVNYSASTKDSLYETYYDIRLNIEMYKTFSFSLMPFILIFVAMFIISINKSAVAEMIQTGVFPQTIVVQFGIGFVFSLVTLALATEWWVHHFYGQYAKAIRTLLDQLKEE